MFDFYWFWKNFKSDNIIWNVDYYDVFLYNYYVWVDILFIYKNILCYIFEGYYSDEILWVFVWNYYFILGFVVVVFWDNNYVWVGCICINVIFFYKISYY